MTLDLKETFEKGGLSALTIVIAEDHPMMRRGLKLMLEASGAGKVFAGSDGAIALDLIRAEKPSLVITDGNMPNMDGFELARQIRADEATAGLPVIFLSALGDNQKEALAAGADLFMDKAAPPEQIIDAIGRVMTARRSASAGPVARPDDWKPS